MLLLNVHNQKYLPYLITIVLVTGFATIFKSGHIKVSIIAGMRLLSVLFTLRKGFSSLQKNYSSVSLCEMFYRVYCNRRARIRVGRVVVVDIARRVDIPRIISIAPISGTQAHIRR